MVAILIGENIDKYVKSQSLVKKIKENIYFISKGEQSNTTLVIDEFGIDYKSYIHAPNQILSDDFLHLAVDFQTQNVIAQRDKIGLKPLYYYNNEEVFLVSDNLVVLKSLFNFKEINEFWISQSLYGIPPDNNSTFYKDLHLLPAAHRLKMQNNQLSFDQYWSLKADSQDVDLEYLKQLFQASISSRMGNFNGAELSGGLDSSGIAGVLSHLLENKKLDAFRHVMTDYDKAHSYPFCDERLYSDKVVSYCKNIEINNIYSEKASIIEDLKREMQVLGTPFYSSLTLLSNQLVQEASNRNVDVLYSGFGGDELVSSKATVYIKELISKNEWAKLFKLTSISYGFKLFLKQFFNISEADWRIQKQQNALLQGDWFAKYDLESKYWNYHNHLSNPALKESFVRKIENPALVHRIMESNMTANVRGLQYAYPLLDADLLQAFMSISSNHLFNYKNPRHLYRTLIKSYLPPEIVNRNDKTIATIPTVFARFMRDYDQIFELLNSYKNGKASKYVDVNKMITKMPMIKQRALGDLSDIRLDLRNFFIGLQLILYFDENILD